ncbi:MAG: hypothetical protein ABI551_10310 [Polyangiaceae bacterium]
MKRALGLVVVASCAFSVVACGGKVLGDDGEGDDGGVTISHPRDGGKVDPPDASTTTDDPDLSALRKKEGQIAYVYFQPQSSIPANVPPSHNVLLDEPKGAQDIYDHTLGLSRFPDGTFSCPAGFGVTYDLQFFAADDSLVADVTVDPNGCNEVQFYDGPTLQANAAYFSVLAKDLGLDEKDIYPYFPQGTP